MKTGKVLKSTEEIEGEFSESGNKQNNSPEHEFCPDNCQNEEMFPNFAEISLSDSTILLLQHDNTEYKTVKEIILEEEMKKLRGKQKKTDKVKDKKSVLNPDIEKITEDDPEEQTAKKIRDRKNGNDGPYIEQNFL